MKAKNLFTMFSIKRIQIYNLNSLKPSCYNWNICTIVAFFLLLYSCSYNEENNAKESNTNKSNTLNFSTEHNIRCINSVESYNGTELEQFNRKKSYGPPRGAGKSSGSLDVFIIERGKEAIFYNTDYALKNGEGIDFKIFENGFDVANSNTSFLEFGFVEVSSDGVEWYGFEPVFEGNVSSRKGKKNIAGLKTVSVHETSNPIDPRLDEAGGDGFDLNDAKKIINRSSENPLEYEYGENLSNQSTIQFVKIVDLSNTLELSALYNGIDIDAICFFYFEKIN